MKQQTASEIFDRHYNAWVSDPEREKSGYDYERTYVEMMLKVEKEVLQCSLGEIPTSRNAKKKSRPVLAE